MGKEHVTVRDLVEALNLDSVTACNNRIAKLYQLHLVRRKASIVPEGGRQYCYSGVF
jgi:predicted transcriptional regulator